MEDASEASYAFPACFREPDALAILEGICAENGHPVELLKDLYQVVMKHSGSGRPDSLNSDLGEILELYCSPDTVS